MDCNAQRLNLGGFPERHKTEEEIRTLLASAHLCTVQLRVRKSHHRSLQLVIMV